MSAVYVRSETDDGTVTFIASWDAADRSVHLEAAGGSASAALAALAKELGERLDAAQRSGPDPTF